jgi:hypothetical protein
MQTDDLLQQCGTLSTAVARTFVFGTNCVMSELFAVNITIAVFFVDNGM